MRKSLLLLTLLVTAIVSFSVTQFLPQEYDFMFISRDNAKYYDQMKKISLFDTIINGLGLEPMIQGILASQLVRYGVRTEQFNELLSGQFLFVQKGGDFFLAIGPASQADKLAKAVADLLGKDTWINAQGSYVLISNNESFAATCLKGGGSLPAEIAKRFEDSAVWAVGYSPRFSYGEAEFGSLLVIKVESDKLTGFAQWEAKNEVAKKLLSELRPDPSYQLHKDPNLSGEIFVFSNVRSAEGVKVILEQLSGSFETSPIDSITETFGFSSDTTDAVQRLFTLSEKSTGKLALSIGIAQLIESLFETQDGTQTVEPSVYSVIQAEITPQEIAKALGHGQVSGNVLKVDSFTIECEGKYVRVYNKSQDNGKTSLQKALRFFDPAEHSFFAFIDFAPIIEELLGIPLQSVLVVVGRTEGDVYTTDWYIQ